MKARYLLPVLAAAITFPALSSPVMTLTSQDIQEGSRMANQFVFNGFGCSGDNLSPQLSWNNAPKGTKSFAITAYDPDAPTGSGWWHWVALDIAADQHNVARGAAKQLKGVRELNNDYGFSGFGGACPPQGHVMHRYQFTVWALPFEKMEIPQGASNALVGFMLRANTLGQATLTATYVSE
ncbi:kinase inhibitor [Vibrio cholerae]|uniref:YbhB/YbcL family Raf kinase inhibitor-like protein n=1 Tax=Vibrio cholerae TaxID=666 RepID=UPI0011D69299|nr:YbhB/YbcL family Raf kinase inhibitor-like protein [Vibrio cholerae]EGR1834518.1 YbhB/YbcL family Raf kinase inhibitor-like protein [Vibrio cholerae]EJL6550685.1 YbhB/YbcL family Raf kinase inhibitor-like protein [Vibrio cholerae]ELJ8524530.1 YbhB/YbcL family Raf kinase inhibitor-like protein [Vibrio cholerae]TXX79481.1 YbhB/YbcL family Raf kinase inhibitor-like protein [Vibrio cholerae]GHY74286.1 kinase inhibitor [Vibrio cholerae]